jgi:hypothetical protein
MTGVPIAAVCSKHADVCCGMLDVTADHIRAHSTTTIIIMSITIIMTMVMLTLYGGITSGCDLRSQPEVTYLSFFVLYGRT